MDNCTPNVSCTRTSSSTASRECPPRSKKLSEAEIEGVCRRSDQISARRRSVAVEGGLAGGSAEVPRICLRISERICCGVEKASAIRAYAGKVDELSGPAEAESGTAGLAAAGALHV